MSIRLTFSFLRFFVLWLIEHLIGVPFLSIWGIPRQRADRYWLLWIPWSLINDSIGTHRLGSTLLLLSIFVASQQLFPKNPLGRLCGLLLMGITAALLLLSAGLLDVRSIGLLLGAGIVKEMREWQNSTRIREIG